MQLDPPHVRLVNTYWENARPVGQITRKVIGVNAYFEIEAEYARPYNNNIEAGRLLFLIDPLNLLPYRLTVEREYAGQKASGVIEFSDFNLPMTVGEPDLG